MENAHNSTARRQGPDLHRRGDRIIAAVGLILIGAFMVLALVSLTLPPARGETLISLSLVSVSFGVALVGFRFLRGQTASIRFRTVGAAISIGGALAAGIIVFGSLQFAIRGTSNLVVELYGDPQFNQPWRGQQGSAPPEFAASLESYTVIAKPDDFIVRFHRLPIFERVLFYSRDPSWRITRLETNDRLCAAKDNVSLSGWCTGARAVVANNNCLDQWSGSGSLKGNTLGQVIDYFLEEMQKVGYPAKKLPALGQKTLSALNLEIRPSFAEYNKLDFCTAINPVKAALEQKLKGPVKIALSCDTIGIAVGQDKLPEPSAGQGWKTPC